MRRNGLTARAADARAQWETDHQRWADDGGASPDATEPDGLARGPVTDDRTGLPVLLVYRRPAREARRPTAATESRAERGASILSIPPCSRVAGLTPYRGN
jgi:hypothetical protein